MRHRIANKNAVGTHRICERSVQLKWKTLKQLSTTFSLDPTRSLSRQVFKVESALLQFSNEK